MSPEVEVFLGEVPIAPYETPGCQKFAETVLPFVRQTNVIILANHAAQLDRENKPVVAKEGTWQPDKIINGYAGMEARAGWSKDVPKLLLNEPVPGVNWNYAEFTADKKPRPESNQAVCLACHRPAAKTSFVYGYSLIKAAATAR